MQGKGPMTIEEVVEVLVERYGEGIRGEEEVKGNK